MGDYDPIEAYLVGYGLTEREAVDCTMRRYRLLREAEERKIEEMWKVARWNKFMDMRLSPNLKNPPNRPEDLFKLPSDRERFVEKVEITEDIINGFKLIGLL